MTWAKLDDRFNDHPVLLTLSRGVRLTYVEAIVWCCKHETDGVIPAGALPRFTDEPEPLSAAARLVDVGLWVETDDGWEVVDFLTNQRSAADITAARQKGAARQDRWRRHREGDHSLCDPRYCRSRNAVTNGVSRSVSNDSPTRPVPSSSVGTRSGTDRSLGVAVAPTRVTVREP